MKVTPYTVRGGTSGSCAACGAKLREGDAALAVLTPGCVEHRHAEPCTPTTPGGTLAAELLANLHQEVTRG